MRGRQLHFSLSAMVRFRLLESRCRQGRMARSDWRERRPAPKGRELKTKSRSAMSGFFVCCECAAVGSPESFTVGVSHQALPTIERSQHRSRCRGGNPGWSNPPDTLRWIGGCFSTSSWRGNSMNFYRFPKTTIAHHDKNNLDAFVGCNDVFDPSPFSV